MALPVLVVGMLFHRQVRLCPDPTPFGNKEWRLGTRPRLLLGIETPFLFSSLHFETPVLLVVLLVVHEEREWRGDWDGKVKKEEEAVNSCMLKLGISQKPCKR